MVNGRVRYAPQATSLLVPSSRICAAPLPPVRRGDSIPTHSDPEPRPTEADVILTQYWAHVTAHVRFILETHPVGTSDDVRRIASRYLESAAEVVPAGLRRELDELDAPRTVRRAVAFIQANLLEHVTAVDIAVAAGSSPRALQLAFRRALDLTPMGYVRDARLTGAHAQLLVDSHTPVGQIALKWGFSNQGRFAAAYRERYGETPTQTRGRLDHTRDGGSEGTSDTEALTA
jgi:transcriptional regulator GlxA family with amidase domain